MVGSSYPGAHLAPLRGDDLPIVVDAGVSRSLSPIRSDFVSFKPLHRCLHRISAETNIEGLLQWDTAGKERESEQFSGRTLFVDHVSHLVTIFHQISLAGGETLVSKRLLEREASASGVQIKHYHGDNGIFAWHHSVMTALSNHRS